MSKSVQEISSVSIILFLIKYKNLLVKKWKFILVVCVFSGLLGITTAWLDDKVYTAELTFALDEKSASSSYSSIASQFGVDLGKGDGGMFKGDNILELFKSKTMIENTLLSQGNFAPAQLFIDRYFFTTGMSLNPAEINFNQNRNDFNRAEDSTLQIVVEDILKNKLECEKLDKGIAIVKLKFKSTDEFFAKAFVEKLTQVVSLFYLDTKTKKQKTNIYLLEMRIDSVKNELDKELNAAANSQDQNINSSVAKLRVPLQKRQMNIQLLTTLYGELTKNVELSKMSLVKEEPLIQIIDRPTFPLKYTKKGRMITGIIYSLIGGFLVVLYIVGVDIWSNFNNVVKREQERLNNERES